MKRKFFILGLLMALFLGIADFVSIQAIAGPPESFGRPIIKNNSVYTAWGTPIRGAQADIDWDDREVSRARTIELLDACLQNGMNAVHIYMEYRNYHHPIGWLAENVDFAIEEAAKRGMYVVIKMGQMDYDHIEEDSQYMYDFWEFYAPRYKDKENVIYEICNECPAPPENVLKAYNIIRKHAPDTMVIFYSFSVTPPPEYYALPILRETMRLAEGSITWTNEAVGFHAYESTADSMGADWIYHVIDAFIDEGFPIINTEVPCYYELSPYAYVDLYKALEERGISWLGFVTSNLIAQPSHWKGRFEAEGFTWQSDYGNWPVVDAVYPFGITSATANVAQTTARSTTDAGLTVLALSNDDFVRYDRLNFGTREPLSFNVSIKSSNGGEITVRQDGPDGVVLGSCEVPQSDDYIKVSGDILTAVDGVANIALVFSSEDTGATYLRDWQFVLPKSVTYIDPYKIVDAANYPYRADGIVRRPSTDIGSEAKLQVEGITNDSYLLFDFVRFTDTNDIPFHIRAMPIEGGYVEILVGDFKNATWEVGTCKISGPPGVWNEFSCPLTVSDMWLVGGRTSYWDLKLVFKGADGKELFAISEFWLGDTKSARADTLDPTVKTGLAQNITANSTIIAGNEFAEFDNLEILETGVWLSLADDFDPLYTTIIATSSSPFTVSAMDLEHNPEVPYFKYRAYVKTTTGTYLGGVKRFLLNVMPTDATPYILTVQDSYAQASGSGSYAAGARVPISAGSRTGYTFAGWNTSDGLDLANPNAATTTFPMPTKNVTIAVIWEKITSYNVTVQYSYAQASGSGSYAAGARVPISAGSRTGYTFAGWNTSDGLDLANPNAATTTFPMPTKNVTIAVIWEKITSHNVTVQDSYAQASGSGSYAAGTRVTISAGRRTGYTFAGWKSSNGVSFANPSAETTTFTIPTRSVTVTATWKRQLLWWLW